MSAAMHAEYLKLVTTRAFYGLLAAGALLSAFIAFGLVAQGPPPWHVTQDDIGQIGSVLAVSSGLFCLILGMRSFTDEFRYGTAVHTAFSDPHRTRTTVAKATVAGVAGLVLTLVSLGLSAVVLVAMTSLTGGTIESGGDVGRVAGGLLVGGVMWGILGVGAAALIRQPVPAVVTALLWVLVFENVAALVLGPAVRYLPGQTAQVLARGADEAAAAAGVMAAWAAVLCLAGWWSYRQRDVI